jgi:uncharacterized protein (DUF1810 family)
MTDPFNLKRFVDAQAPVYRQVVSELRAGRKRSHWMWFIFPQVAGLGHSEMAHRFAVSSPDEASAYFAHDVLGSRLVECTGLVNNILSGTITEILGQPDDQKFRSSMTLFEAISKDPVFTAAIERYYSERDQATLEIVARWKRDLTCPGNRPNG